MMSFIFVVAKEIVHLDSDFKLFCAIGNQEVREKGKRYGVVIAVVHLIGPLYLPMTRHIICFERVGKRA